MILQGRSSALAFFQVCKQTFPAPAFMKSKSILAVIAILAAATISAPAQIIVSADNIGNLTQMPGSPTDYSFLGADGQFGPFGYGGGTPDTGVQTHFTMASDVGESYGGDGRYSVINNPLGASTQTGILFGRAGNTNQNILTLNLGTNPGFNYANFDLYVLYGNASGDGQVRDTALTLTDGVTLFTDPVLDTNTNLALASFAVFHITGALPGDTIEIGATSPLGINYVGGVSLRSLPEPSTYAMSLFGIAFLGFCLWRKRAGNQVKV
jgi:hypothetical protein